MTGSTTIWVRSQFIAFHRWKDAPIEVAFLRQWHRHVFHVQLELNVNHLERAVEFFMLKEELNKLLSTWENGCWEYSCETFATYIAQHFQENYDVRCVSVSEDNENGACVYA